MEDCMFLLDVEKDQTGSRTSRNIHASKSLLEELLSKVSRGLFKILISSRVFEIYTGRNITSSWLSLRLAKF